MSTNEFTVTGMTCGGCAAKVTNAVSAVDGVTDVQANVSDGSMTVIGDGRADTADIVEAVREAGYDVASTS
jgi:copper chaperone